MNRASLGALVVVTFTACSRAGGGSGGTAPTPIVLWQDGIQTETEPCGFDGFGVQHPIGTEVDPNDANGANLSRVPNPLPGGGYALRHYGVLDEGGARAQAGIYGDFNTVFGEQAKRPEGVYVAQEWYFPETVTALGTEQQRPYCWYAVLDFHSIDSATRGNRWWGTPGFFIPADGTMRLVMGWSFGTEDTQATIPVPVGRWFDFEVHYMWANTPTATIRAWIDGQLAIEQHGVQTYEDPMDTVELYEKLYGSNQGGGCTWSPTPTIRYTRNVRIGGERIWR